uniref:Putative secreted protein n=1 Tax=Xenopsylla cheopis TaxID=163159 RepID=A0A6M2E1V9_XENCH
MEPMNLAKAWLCLLVDFTPWIWPAEYMELVDVHQKDFLNIWVMILLILTYHFIWSINSATIVQLWVLRSSLAMNHMRVFTNAVV